MPAQKRVSSDQQTVETAVIAPNNEAGHAADEERKMTLWQSIKLYPNAVGWSLLFASALVMEGYDLALLGSLYGNEQFKRKYGIFDPVSGSWVMQASWQSAL